VGWISQSHTRFGLAFAIIVLGPIGLIVLIVRAFPETAHRSLEELNPVDQPADRGGESLR